MASYIGLIHKDTTSDFGVSFPDFPGCVSAGSTLDEAQRMGQEALQLHVDGAQEDGAEIPEPSSIDQIVADRANKGAVLFVAKVKVREARSVRINVTFREDLLEKIDEQVARQRTTRAAFLAHAARQEIARSDDSG